MNLQPIRSSSPPAPPPGAALLAAIVDSTGDAIISRSLTGVITSWNAAAERMLGFRSAEAIGQPTQTIIPFERMDEDALALAAVGRGEIVTPFETERLRKDGTRIVVSVTLAALRNAKGSLIGTCEITRNLTAEKTLQAREHLLSDFFENGAIGLHCVGPDGTILKANRAELDLLGYSADEYVGRSVAEFHADPAVIDNILQRLSAGKSIDNQEAWLRCKDGSIKHVLITSNGLWEEGKFVHTRCFTRDVTEQKQVEAQVSATIRELNDLKTALDQHAIVAVTDPRGRIINVNEKFCAISKYSREELLGQDHRIINSGYHSKEFFRDLWHTIRSGRVWKGEIKNRAKDGTFYWVDTTIVPYLNERGEPTQFVAIRADITDRKRTEEMLRESEERFRTLADAAPVLIWVADTDKLCNYFNKRWLNFVGRTMEEELGHGWTENVHPDDYERCMNVYLTAFDARQPFEMEYRMRHHSGEYRWILDRGVPRLGPNGTFQGYIGGCTEIETQKRAEGELEKQVTERTAHLKESIASLEGICYTIAHDLRAPLRAIHGYTNILLKEYAPAFDAEGKHLAQRVVANAARMDNLIHDLLEYARLNHLELSWEEVNLNAVVHDVLAAMAEEIQAKKGVIQVHPLPTLRAHRLLLAQIFTNLLENALKFVEKGEVPKIEIGFETRAGGVRVWIQDNGIGIHPEHHAGIFEMFHRLHPNEAIYPGTGVGLAIVRKGMERMGGCVGIASTSEMGTRFYLDFANPTLPEEAAVSDTFH
jgi:PAS domain S-box-containing protein